MFFSFQQVILHRILKIFLDYHLSALDKIPVVVRYHVGVVEDKYQLLYLPYFEVIQFAVLGNMPADVVADAVYKNFHIFKMPG